MRITFTVYGRPATQGSKRAFVRTKKDGSKVAIVTEDNKRLLAWRQEVASAALQVYDGPLITGPVRLSVEYFYHRPQSHYGRGRNARTLSASAPVLLKTTTPDLSKLTRAIEDALSGVLYRDDALIVDRHDSKCWGERDMAVVTVETVEEA
ncbi:hypothetical protein LCGC14_1355730 [marine sediment metagenome]|uniref:Uncharacterized protein n=1 Tax=marine sediment metagenome TaxID=412755 RepID=A0A0F9KAA8_9ZZZZ